MKVGVPLDSEILWHHGMVIDWENHILAARHPQHGSVVDALTQILMYTETLARRIGLPGATFEILAINTTLYGIQRLIHTHDALLRELGWTDEGSLFAWAREIPADMLADGIPLRGKVYRSGCINPETVEHLRTIYILPIEYNGLSLRTESGVVRAPGLVGKIINIHT